MDLEVYTRLPVAPAVKDAIKRWLNERYAEEAKAAAKQIGTTDRNSRVTKVEFDLDSATELFSVECETLPASGVCHETVTTPRGYLGTILL